MTSGLRYRVEFGDDEPLELPDDYSMAQGWLFNTIEELHNNGALPSWRAQALRVSADNMPRAGFSFLVNGIGLVKVERV